ncbi:MAG: hypothetical protein WCP46_08695 [Alphaproteobacteria bacterium]
MAITDEFIRVSKTATWDNACQALRIVGYRHHDTRMITWCTEKFHEDVIKTYKINQELVKKLNESFCYHKMDGKSSYDVLSEARICKGKVPRGKLCKKVKMPMEKITGKTDDFLESVDSYRKDIDRTAMMDEIRSHAKNPTKNETIGKYIIVEHDEKSSLGFHRMVGDVIAILIENDKFDEDVKVDWINQSLAKKYPTMKLDSIRGTIWTPIRSKKFNTSDIKARNSLLYWNENGKPTVCLTSA